MDVFVTLPSGPAPTLVSLSSVYEWAKNRGIEIQGEHLMIERVPVQLLPAYNALVEEAVAEARVHDYEDVQVRVVDPEHLVALALQAGGARRRERAWHQEQARLPLREKVRMLIELQRQDLPLLARRRPLRPWERPWEITP